MRILTIIIIAVIGIAALFIFKMRSKEANEQKQRLEQIKLDEGYYMSETERLRRELAQGFAPFEAERDPDLEKLYDALPYKVTYYNPERMDEATSQLLFGTGTAPIYERMQMYPMHTAPVYESQLQHNVPKPNRYDYISKWETMLV